MSDFHKEDSKTSGRWTRAEHEKFLLGLQLYGKEWKKIEALVGTRSGAQIRSHAQKFFIKNKKESASNETVEEAEEQTSSVTPSSPSENYSYFFSKIVCHFTHEEDFDFWGHLIDHKPSCSPTEPIRKNSFMTISSDSASEYEQLPTKHIKTDDSY